MFLSSNYSSQSIRRSECPKGLEPADRRSQVSVNLTRRVENYPVSSCTSLSSLHCYQYSCWNPYFYLVNGTNVDSGALRFKGGKKEKKNSGPDFKIALAFYVLVGYSYLSFQDRSYSDM